MSSIHPMAISHTYDPDLNRLTMRASGTLTVPQLEVYLAEVLSNPDIREGFVELVDLSDVDDLAMKFAETSVFEPIWRKYVDKGVARTVVLAPTDSTFGLFRMLITSLVAAMGTEDIPFYVYRDCETAMRALEGDIARA